MNDIAATIADEWGSVLCYNKCSRSTPSATRCRCFDIANALAAAYDIRPRAVAVTSMVQKSDPLYDSRNPNHGRIGGLYEEPVSILSTDREGK